MIPVLDTERLVLRAPALADFEAYAAFFASPRSGYEDGPLTRGPAWKEFASAAGQWLLKGYGAWSLEERATGTYAGEVGIFHPAHYPEPELGWTLMAPFEGRGFAFEAARAARAWAYGSRGLTTLVSYIAPGNARSTRLAERLGAVLDPAAPMPELDPCAVYRHPGPAEVAA
jgi:RimJ/RimL family protein N-acetyltransferase